MRNGRERLAVEHGRSDSRANFPVCVYVCDDDGGTVWYGMANLFELKRVEIEKLIPQERGRLNILPELKLGGSNLGLSFSYQGLGGILRNRFVLGYRVYEGRRPRIISIGILMKPVH